MKNRKNKGLGRGIDALFHDSFDADESIKEKSVDKKQNKSVSQGTDSQSVDNPMTDSTHEQVMELPLEAIRANPYQPRMTFDEDALQELSESIKIQGVFQPVIVRQSQIKGYDLIAGERRVRASRLAGKETIPAIVRAYDDMEMIQIAIVENLQREDLSAIEEAKAYRRLMDELHLTQQEVSNKVGKSRSYIANFVRLLSLPLKAQQALESGIITVGHARALIGLKEEEQILHTLELIIKEHWNVRQTEQYLQALSNPEESIKKERTKKEKSPFITAYEEQLMDKFGTNVSIVEQATKHSGKIQIEYLSERDLARILELLEITLDD
ncbi:ParB/RepB/Spo0J family partition protein [Atopobacter phocae]|uniref:ParB/RepB/Spo0J family partition protein n=1 Tax=Atopobacter phocae TaxID=136492 RepID=UPI000470F578|nr:ParB/RepB/Spo0J family partition protein [Atopobacter phocae]